MWGGGEGGRGGRGGIWTGKGKARVGVLRGMRERDAYGLYLRRYDQFLR